MTRFEDCFPPDIVRAVHQRLKNDGKQTDRADETSVSNVISLAAYRQKMMREGTNVVS